MSGKAIMEQPEPTEQIKDWQATREVAPSLVREDEPTLARIIGFSCTLTAVLGGMALAMIANGRMPGLIGLSWGSVLLEVGLIGMLFHAASERDLQFRRWYLVFGYLCLAFGVALCLWPVAGNVGGALGWGVLSMLVGLLFVTASLRHETEGAWRAATTSALGMAGLLLALVGIIGSNIGQGEFLLPNGLLLSLLGLAYLSAFAAIRGSEDDLGYRVGQAVALLGVVVFLVALGRSALPPLFHAWHWLGTAPAPYFIPAGLLLMGLGLLYTLVGVGLSSEARWVVLTRRELGAFFYSPVAYIVLLGFVVVGFVEFIQFVNRLAYWNTLQRGNPMIEPIVQSFIVDLFPMIAVIFAVPALTMRLFSEEKRVGTLEVLLTAPVGDVSVVFSKFLAAVLFFLLLWLPWGLFLVALRLGAGQAFDYRPLLGFSIALVCTGAAFVSMGLFFSSLTSSQIVSAVLTFVGMLALFGIFLALRMVQAFNLRAWAAVLNHMSFVNLWWDSLEGKLELKYLLFYLSATVFWLFLTVKVLEARKWR